MAQIKLAEYTFDNSVGDVTLTLTPNTITMTKEDSVSGTTTRRIVYIDNATMPTQIKFSVREPLLTVDYLNIDSNITSMHQLLHNAQKLTYINVDNWNTSNVTNLYQCFYMTPALTQDIDFTKMNFAKVTGWHMAFAYSRFPRIDLSNSSPILADAGREFFAYCKAEYINISGWTFTRAMNQLFNNAEQLKTVVLNNVTTTGVTNMKEMFRNCYNLKTIDVSSFDTSSVTDASHMFTGCEKVTEIKGIENFNVSSNQWFNNMFYKCSSLTKLDLRNWVTSKAADMSNMFSGCSSLEVLRVDNFNTSNVGSSSGTGMSSMFARCGKLKTLNLNSFTRGTSLTKITGFLQFCASLEYFSMQNFDFSGIITFQTCIQDCKSLKMLDLTMWDTSSSSTATFTYCFNGVTCPIYYNSNICTNTTITSLSNAIDVKGRLMAIYDFNNTVTTSDSAYPVLTGSTVTKTIDTQGSESHITHRVIGVDVMPTAIQFGGGVLPGLLNVDYLAVTSSCTSLNKLFYNCTKLKNINTFGWDVSNTSTMEYSFATNSISQNLDLTSWNFRKNGVNFAHMFEAASSKYILLPRTPIKVTGFFGAFAYNGNLSELDLSMLDVSSCPNISNAFNSCTGLMELDLSSFILSSSASSSIQVFDGWTSDQIVYVHDTNWNINTSSYNATFVRRLSKLLAQYTFDNSIGDCLPTITGITTSDYKVSDIVNDTITTRFLSTDSDKVITKISFGSLGKTSSLLTLDYLKIDKNITQMNDMFQACSNVTTINAQDWDTSNVTNMGYLFQGCGSLTEVIGLETWDTSKVEYMNQMFTNSKVPNVSAILNWNVSNCKSFAYMFGNANILDTELNLSNWQPNNLENCQNMFANSPFTSINLSGWNVPKLSNMSSMFAGAGINSKLLSVNMSNWTMGTPTNMNSMFYNNSNLTSIDFTGSKMISSNLQQTFQSCTKLTSLDVSGFDTSQCTTLQAMFFGCSSLTSVDLSSWDTSQCTTMQGVFYGCSKLETLNISNFNTKNVNNVSNMFEGCLSLKTLDLSTWDTRKVTFTNAMFQGWDNTQTVCYEPPFWSIGTTTLNSNINWVIQVTRNNGYWLDMSDITGATEITLYNENNLPTEDILTDWGDGTQNSELTHTYSTAGEYVVVSNLQMGGSIQKIGNYTTKAVIHYYTKPQDLFFGFLKLTEIDFTDNYVTLINEKKPTNFGRMFYNNVKLQKLPDNLSRINTSSATSTSQMFYGLRDITSENSHLDLSWMDVSNVTDMTSMFEWNVGIKSINTTGWNTSKVQNMTNMFHGAKGFTNLDLSHWNVSSCTNMTSMFNEASALTSLDVSSWNFEKCTAINQFIRQTTNLVDFNMSGVTFGATRVNFQNFAYQSGVQNVNMSNITTADIVSFESPFYGCGKLKTIDFSNSHFKPNGMQNMFYGCKELTSVDLSSYDTSQCTSMKQMFSGCNAITSINMSGWNTVNVIDMGDMFRNTTSLQVLDVSNWDVSSVNSTTGSISYMFTNTRIKHLDLSSWKITDDIKYCSYVFLDNPNLEQIDLSNWLVTQLQTYHFRGSSKLKTIGMLYSSAEAINALVASGFSKTEERDGITIYYQDADPSQLTPVEGVTFKKYQNPTTIQLPPHIQLHSLPDGTRDEVDIKTGILTRNVGYVKFDGTQTYTKQAEKTNTIGRSYANLNPTNNQAITNWLPNVGGLANKDVEGIGYSGQNSTIYVRVSKERIGGNGTQEDLDVYLEQHPLEVIYTTTPTTEQLILNYNNSCDYGRILPTGMCDKYDVVNSMYTQTMTSILLDGANTWDAMEEFENTIKFTATGTTVGVENLNMLGAGGLYCDNDLFPNINDDSDVPHCRVDEAGNKFYIYVDKEMLMSPDLIGWQIWLQANNFNLIYELAEHLTYVKSYEELDPTQARWEGMDCMRDGAIKYHTNSSDNITMYPTLEYVAPSINNFEVTMLEPNTDYTIYAEGINKNDTINLGGNDINFNNGTVYTSGDNQWLRIDNNDSFYNMVITKGDTTGEVVPYFEGMTSVENPAVCCGSIKNLFDGKFVFGSMGGGGLEDAENRLRSENYIPIQPNTKYTITCYSGYNVRYVAYYDENKNFISGTNFNSYNVMKVTTPSDNSVKYMLFNCAKNDTSENFTLDDLRNTKAQVELGGVSTEYTPPLSEVSYTDLKLRSLPNGVKDTINVVTGEYVQRIGEVVLDGSEDWVLSAHENSIQFYTPLNNLVRKVDYLNSMSCDKFVVYAEDRALHDSISPNGISAYVDWLNDYPNENWLYIKHADSESSVEKFKQWLKENPVTVQYELAEPIITKLDPQTLLAYTDGTINLSSDTGLLPTTHYTVPSTNTFHLPSMKTGTRYTLKYPSASGSITIGDITYKISSDSMLFTTPLKINGDTSAIIFSDANPKNVILLEGAYNKREVPFFTGVKSVKNPNITIIDQLSTESTTYNCETEIELRGLPNGVADKLDIVKGKLTTNVGIRPYQEGDENLPNIWTDGYETVYALSSPVVTNVAIDNPTVTTNSLIELSSDYLIPQLNYRAPSSNNFPLDLLQPNTTYTLYADTLASGSYTLGGTRTGVYSQPHTITLGDMTDNLLTFNGDLGLSNVMLVKGNSLKTTLPPYFLGIRSVTDGHLLVEGMAGEMNELTIDEGIVLRDCNGVKDTIDLITCTLTKRTGEITLTGAEGWYRADSESTTDYNVFKLTLSGLKEALVMCDTLQSVFDTKMMDCIHAHTNELCIVIANATIGGNTVNALKSWLNQHPTTVVYQLRTPIEVQLENVWTTTPPTSYSNQTEISSTVSTNSLKPMISVTIATTTLEEIVSNLETRNTQLEEENLATMLALTSVYETMVAPSVATTSVEPEPQATTYSMRRSVRSAEPIGMSVSPMGMVYARLVSKGFKSIDEVPYNLQAEVMYALRGME